MTDLAISNEQLIRNLDEIASRVEKWPEWKKEASVVLGLGENVTSIHCKTHDLNRSIPEPPNDNRMGIQNV